MTQDLTPKDEPTQPALCVPCAGIQRNWRRAPGHPELVQGDNRKEERDGHSVAVTRYQCSRCGAIWDYENNKSNQKAGWSLPRR